jgi:thiol-disulfide isomerase/thioredoxin
MQKLIFFLSLSILISCSTGNEKKYRILKKVIIAGKVENFNLDNSEISLSVNRPCFSQETIFTNLDSLGNFSFSFESYIPTDIWLHYRMNFLVLTHPGDSIYVEFDGEPWSRPAILKTIKYSGDAVKANQDAATFQRMYFSNALYTDRHASEKAIKEYEVDDYITYMDTLRQMSKDLFKQFVADVSPNEETKTWALTYLDQQHYYNPLAEYPELHRSVNNLNWNEWDVPVTYYDPLLNRFPITESMFISGFALINFINRYQSFYVRINLWDEEANQKYKSDDGYINASREIIDSLMVYSIIKYTPDTLMRQMVLTDLFYQSFKRYDIDLFEDFQDIAETYILESFLREPLFQMYYQTKDRLEHPQIASDAILKKAANSSANQILDSIFFANKGRIIYLDCWATWCGPCITEMPNSKDLMKQLKEYEKDVAFVFLCLNSEEKAWKAALDKFDIGGQHYFLSEEQSNSIIEILEIQGVPHYLLIDKNGIIIEKGSHLRPKVVKEKILKLLE